MSSKRLIRILLFSTVLVFMAGCSEDPVVSVQAPGSPRNLAVIGIDSTTRVIADLSWQAPTDSSGITGYRIWWNEMPQGKLDSIDVAGTIRIFRFDNLKEKTRYEISAAAMRGTLMSPRVSVEWVSPSLPIPPSPPVNLQAATFGSTAVSVSWTAPEGTGLTYTLGWRGGSTNMDTGSVTGLTNTMHTVVNLQSGTSYLFTLRAVRISDGTISQPATITWGTAIHFTDDVTNGSLALRLYEPASANGSGLTIDPFKGGPRNISVTNASPNVQLGMYAAANSTSFIIGPAYAITEFGDIADAFDAQVYISDSTYLATSLSTWYSSKKISDYIPANGNVRAFTMPAQVSDSRGHGFYLRTGPAGNYRYARLFVKNEGGRLLQGTAPNRYVEVALSYQVTPNLPYAKRVGMVPSPGGIASRPVGR